MKLAFISGGELLMALFVGLLLFGGRLPDVAKQVGQVFFRLRKSFEDMRREAGFDEALRDVRREVERSVPRPQDFQPGPPSAAGPAAHGEPEDAAVEKNPAGAPPPPP